MENIGKRYKIVSLNFKLKYDMKKLKYDVLEFIRKNSRVRHAIADLFTGFSGGRLSDVTVLLWIKKNDPRLTCISVLEIISDWIEKPIDELTTDGEPNF